MLYLNISTKLKEDIMICSKKNQVNGKPFSFSFLGYQFHIL